MQPFSASNELAENHTIQRNAQQKNAEIVEIAEKEFRVFEPLRFACKIVRVFVCFVSHVMIIRTARANFAKKKLQIYCCSFHNEVSQIADLYESYLKYMFYAYANLFTHLMK